MHEDPKAGKRIKAKLPLDLALDLPVSWAKDSWAKVLASIENTDVVSALTTRKRRAFAREAAKEALAAQAVADALLAPDREKREKR
jgi:hypothetical protein